MCNPRNHKQQQVLQFYDRSSWMHHLRSLSPLLRFPQGRPPFGIPPRLRAFHRPSQSLAAPCRFCDGVRAAPVRRKAIGSAEGRLHSRRMRSRATIGTTWRTKIHFGVRRDSHPSSANCAYCSSRAPWRYVGRFAPNECKGLPRPEARECED